MKVCILIPYFGRWPRLFNLYLESCRHNPGLDVLIFTDLEPPDDVPGNVRFEPATLAELRERFSRRLGFEVALRKPHKLCDFKPTYGALFEDYLAGYDFWGHGDIDLVYGNLSPILERRFLERFDVISFREDWIWGPFNLYRNTPEVNWLFRTSQDIEMIFRNDRHLAFDESSYRWAEMKSKSVFDIDFPYENMTLLVRRAEREGRVRAHFETAEVDRIATGSHLMWDEGRIVYGGKEWLFCHWGSFMRFGELSLPRWNRCPKRFYVTPHGLYTQRQFESPFFHLLESSRKARYRVRQRIRSWRPAARRLRKRVRRVRRLIRQVAAAGARFARLQLNLYLLLRLQPSTYDRLPARLKDGRALLLRRYRSQGHLFFIQIGSNDGIRRDPIRRFVMRHRWAGIMVEPVPSIFDVLVANYRGNPELHFENVAIAEQRGTLPFYSLRSTAGTLPEWHDQIGSLLPDTLLRYRRAIPDIERHIVEDKVRAITYADLMEKHGEPRVDFLHIDTEGYDFRIIRSIDLTRHRPPIILYENVIMSDDEREECMQLLRRSGYMLIVQGPDTFAFSPG
jgi:FkbM family methyltransferase